MRVVSVVSRLLHARPAAAALRTFATSSACCQTGADPKSPGLNHSGKLNLRGFEATASIPVSDVVASGKPRVSICRCWLSAKFPYCDGSHTHHNKRTGDSIGPLRLTIDAPKKS